MFVPVPVQGLRNGAELDQEVAGQVSGLDLAPLFLPAGAAPPRHSP